MAWKNLYFDAKPFTMISVNIIYYNTNNSVKIIQWNSVITNSVVNEHSVITNTF